MGVKIFVLLNQTEAHCDNRRQIGFKVKRGTQKMKLGSSAGKGTGRFGAGGGPGVSWRASTGSCALQGASLPIWLEQRSPARKWQKASTGVTEATAQRAQCLGHADTQSSEAEVMVLFLWVSLYFPRRQCGWKEQN